MMISESFEALKDSTTGVILLGAIGSLAATAIAFSINYLANQLKRRTNAIRWDLGWIVAYCDGDLINMPIFLNFIIAVLGKMILLCTIAILMLVISLFCFGLSRDLSSYGVAIIPLSIGIYALIVSYSDYKSLKINTNWWIDNRKKERQNKLSPTTTKTPTARSARRATAKG
jgi:hypothetical protein